MVKKRNLTVKDVAEELNISKQTVLRYEGKGIFPKPARNPINGWRRYSDKDIEKLKKILEKGSGQ